MKLPLFVFRVMDDDNNIIRSRRTRRLLILVMYTSSRMTGELVFMHSPCCVSTIGGRRSVRRIDDLNVSRRIRPRRQCTGFLAPTRPGVSVGVINRYRIYYCFRFVVIDFDSPAARRRVIYAASLCPRQTRKRLFHRVRAARQKGRKKRLRTERQ